MSTFDSDLVDYENPFEHGFDPDYEDEEEDDPLYEYQMPGPVYHHSDDFRNIAFQELPDGCRFPANREFGKRVGIPNKLILRF